MIRSSKYIIKRIIIGIGIAIGVMLFKDSILTAHALSYQMDTLYLDNSGIYQEVWYERPIDTGFNIKLVGVADTDLNTNLYVQVLICAGPSNNSVIWVPGDQPNSWTGTQRNVTINNTNVPCKVGTTSGKVQQLLYTTRAVDGDFTATVRVSYKDGYTGFTFVSYGISDKPWDYIQNVTDYTNQLESLNTTINNKWQQQINKLQDIWGVTQQQLAEAQVQTGWEKRAAEAAEAMHNLMNNDDIDTNDQDSKINTIKNSGYNNNSISSVILMPVKVFESAINGLSSNSCSSINLGNLYNTDLIMPCISSSDMQNWLSSTLYGLIDILMSFCVILGIRKLVLKIYNTIVYLRDGGGTID